MAACFAIAGHRDWAEEALSHFSWGQAFLDINEDLFDIYEQCTDAASIKAAEQKWLDALERDVEDRARQKAEGGNMWSVGDKSGGRPGELPPSDSEDDYISQDDELVKIPSVQFGMPGDYFSDSEGESDGLQDVR